MKWEHADFRAGLVVVGALAIAGAAIVWLKGGREGPHYFSDFDRIGGLAVQTPVQIQGFSVGRVTDITPVVGPGGTVEFRVGMRIEATLQDGKPFPIESGTHAKIQQPSIIGAPVIVLEPPATRGAPLPPGMIPAEATADMIDQVQKLVNDAGGQVTAALVRTLGLVDSLQATLSVVRLAADRSAQVAESTQAAVPRLVASVDRAITHTDSMVQEFRKIAPASRAVLDSIGAAVPDLRAAVRTAAGAANDADPQVRRIVANLDSTSLTLKILARELSLHPMKTFFGGVKPP
jgi:ABC-type transporter Mla subunit MlaD